MPEPSAPELAAMIAALAEKFDRDRYPRVPRPFCSARAKLNPTSVPKSLAPRTPLPLAARMRGSARGR